MADYKKMYYFLAGQIAGAIDSLQSVVEALKVAQQKAEDMYIEAEDDEPSEEE